jgi:hypothetical protein
MKYWIWVDCIILVTIEILIHVISQKTYEQVFHSNKHKCVEKTYFVEKITSIWNTIQMMLEAFVSKSILYVYQNGKWNQRKTTPN